MPPRLRLAMGYLWLQAIVVAAWWLWLWLVPNARSAFVVGDWPESTLHSFALPDVAVLVVGSGAAAVGLARRSAWARPLVWIVFGAVLYATTWCVGSNLATGAGLLGTGLMALSTLGTALAALASRTEEPR